MSSLPLDTSTPEAPPRELLFKRRIRVGSALREFWSARELVRTLAERDIRVRYKQAFLGFAWAVVTPAVLTIVSTLVVKRVARFETGDVPYPLFAYMGSMTWTFFASSANQGGQSLVSNSTLLNKVYCPREVFPAASVGVAMVDLVISGSLLIALFVFYGYVPRATTAWVPLILVVQVAFVLGVTFTMSSVLVYFRDLRHALPLLLQLGLFATPVLYPLNEFVPERSQPLYATANPLAAIIDSYRRTVLDGHAPQWDLLGPASAASLVALVSGYMILKRLETRFADVA